MVVANASQDIGGPGHTSRYEVLSQKKIAHIHPSGYGVLQFETTLLVTDENFTGSLHYVGLDKNVSKELALPPIAQMRDVNFDEAPPKPFLNYILLNPRYRGFRIKPTELPTQRIRGASSVQIEEGRVRAFLLEISPRCSVGQELTYAWEWGFPDLFCMASGAEENSSYECLAPVKQLQLVLSFLRRSVTSDQLFHKQPVLDILWADKDRDKVTLEAPPVEGLRDVSYTWAVGNARAGDRLVLRWTVL